MDLNSAPFMKDQAAAKMYVSWSQLLNIYLYKPPVRDQQCVLDTFISKAPLK